MELLLLNGVSPNVKTDMEESMLGMSASWRYCQRLTFDIVLLHLLVRS